MPRNLLVADDSVTIRKAVEIGLYGDFEELSRFIGQQMLVESGE